MKRILSVVLALVLILPCMAFSSVSFAQESDVYLIQTKAELLAWASNVNASQYQGKVIRLGADITLATGDAQDWFNGKNLPAQADRWTPIASFAGTFDGDGHTISGLCVSLTTEDVGFFKRLENGAVVKNLYITNSFFGTTNNNAGSIAGRSYSASFENIYSDAYLKSKTSAGGIVGTLPEGASPKVSVTLKSCWFDGYTETSGRYSGGMIGHQYHNYATITDCLNTGIITCGTTHAAGISPGVYEGWLIAENCVNLGTTTQNFKSSPELGQAITYTIGSSNAPADDWVVLRNCFGLEGKSKMNPEDVRMNSLVDGEVEPITQANMKSKLSALGSGWNLDGEIPVPAYFAPEVETPEVEPFSIGDANGDGTVNFSDIQRIYQHLSGGTKLQGDALTAADANRDSIVNFSDIQRIYQHLSGGTKLY